MTTTKSNHIRAGQWMLANQQGLLQIILGTPQMGGTPTVTLEPPPITRPFQSLVVALVEQEDFLWSQ